MPILCRLAATLPLLAVAALAQPQPPVLGIARLDSTTFQLDWEPVPDAACYEIWHARDGGGPWTGTATTPAAMGGT